jgi:hypothetical protein
MCFPAHEKTKRRRILEIHAQIVEASVPSEFEIQAWLYSALQSVGINVRGEVKVNTGLSIKGWKTARFDLVIFRSGVPQMIIEVKRSKDKNVKVGHRQYQKYHAFGIPVAYARGMEEARELFSRLTENTEKQKTVTILAQPLAERYPETPLREALPPKRKKRSPPKWYAGKRDFDNSVEVVFGNWDDVRHLFERRNHSHFRGFWREEDARAWVFSLPDRSQFAEKKTMHPEHTHQTKAPW